MNINENIRNKIKMVENLRGVYEQQNQYISY